MDLADVTADDNDGDVDFSLTFTKQTFTNGVVSTYLDKDKFLKSRLLAAELSRFLVVVVLVH